MVQEALELLEEVNLEEEALLLVKHLRLVVEVVFLELQALQEELEQQEMILTIFLLISLKLKEQKNQQKPMKKKLLKKNKNQV